MSWFTKFPIVGLVPMLCVASGWLRSRLVRDAYWSNVMHVRLVVNRGWGLSLSCIWLNAPFRSPRTAIV